MSLYEEIVARKEKIALVGLGYVGMPIAVAFAKKVDVVGFDLNAAKIELYKNGIDPTREVGDEAIKASTVEFTADETKLREAKFHIVAVPTPTAFIMPSESILMTLLLLFKSVFSLLFGSSCTWAFLFIIFV